MNDRPTRFGARLRGEEGFLLLELVMVVALLGILLAMGISYLDIRDRAHSAVARANLVTAVRPVETYQADNGSYAGMTWAALHEIDRGLSATLQIVTVAAQSYCIEDSNGTATFHKEGPQGAVTEGDCP